MSLASVPGQDRAKGFLKELVRTARVPHAMLFSGMAGIGRTAVAREFAKLLNCPSPIDLDCCDRCGSCRKMDGGHHPDIIWVKRDGVFIKLDQIRGLRERLRFRPFEGRWRVIVIEDAQDLKEEAGNSLLKLLEEPPGRNIFLLTALEPQMLLPTIVSRCCHVRFQPLDEPLIERHLTGTYDIAFSRAREIARLSEGSLSRARWLMEEDRLLRWKEILESIRKLHDMSMIDFFPFVSQWAQKSEDLEQDLECIKLWIRELILSRLTIDFPPVFHVEGGMESRVQGVSIENLFKLFNDIEEAMQNLRLNANKQLTLEGLCLAIKEDLYGQGDRNSISHLR